MSEFEKHFRPTEGAALGVHFTGLQVYVAQFGLEEGPGYLWLEPEALTWLHQALGELIDAKILDEENRCQT